ncbi:MAG: HepT-like ribonuclease domain-containing protein [Acidobacteriaceae bacterium]
MPFRDDATRLRDVLESIALIEQFVAGMDFEAYSSDEKTKSAVERQILTLSEAAKALGARAEALCPGHDWKGFRGMGDLLRHAYHRIDDRLVWDSVTKELPPLKVSIEKALAMLTQSQSKRPPER